ncbi:MAG: universal stress protein [Actinomycetota bacterium]|nr:universal stress protein [Actinomycetota bacterium]
MADEQERRQRGPAGMFRRVLVGFDGSTDAQRALRAALALAADLEGEAHVLLVVRPPAHAETPEERDRAAEAEKENLSRGLAGIQTQTQHRSAVSAEVVYADEPARALATYAEEHGFDLVVVGGHGREQMTHRGIGQSVEALLRHHPCPVLVV